VADDARAVGLERQGDHVEHQPGVFRIAAAVAGDAVARRALAEVGSRHLGLGPVDPFAFDLDAFFEVADGGEVLIEPLAVGGAHRRWSAAACSLMESSRLARCAIACLAAARVLLSSLPKSFSKSTSGDSPA
jgi:hypothetical protein